MTLNNNILNQAKPANSSTTSGNIPVERSSYSAVSLKELIAKQEVQEALRRYVDVPDLLTIKKLRKAFDNKETKTITQKIVAMSGTTIEDAVTHELTLLGMELNPVEAVNKKYRIIDYTLGLEANMSAGKFNGYVATGLKLMVTRLEEVKGDKK